MRNHQTPAVRQTLFAIISSIESDLRNILLSYYPQEKYHFEELLGIDRYKKYKDRMDRDNRYSVEKFGLKDLIMYCDFQEPLEIINSNSGYISEDLKRRINKITPLITTLTPIRNRVFHNRPLQPDDFPNVQEISNKLRKDKDTWKSLRETLHGLSTDPYFLFNYRAKVYRDIDEIKSYSLPLPDFDETGFIGRERILKDLIQTCNGPYPVITIVGEGGIGKTALCLKLAYDILDSNNNPFDTIIWVTCKSSLLTSSEIIRIERSIKDSLGLFSDVEYKLSGQTTENPIVEILEYLKEFKILLILDNLETVLDDRIRNFLKKLEGQSKVIITTRIGVGAYEYPVKLEPLSSSESVQLLRSIAIARKVNSISNLKNENLLEYCKQMSFNAGFIKWFVSAVQYGKRPEKLLSNPSIFLDYCMSNVYEYLTDSAKKLLSSMLYIRERLSVAELSMFDETDPVDVQKALQELLTTNFIHFQSYPVESSFLSTYELTELSRAYLLKHHPIPENLAKQYAKKRNQLISLEEQVQSGQSGDLYSAKNIYVSSRTELIVAKYLRQAMNKIFQKKYDESEELINRAKEMAPDYFEVYRAGAFLKYYQGDLSEAGNLYEAAIDLKPKHAPLRLFYGGFLLRNNNPSKAFEELSKANEIDTESTKIKIELARANMYLKNFEKALTMLNMLKSRTELEISDMLMVDDLILQIYKRKGETLADKRNHLESLSAYEEFMEFYSKLRLKDSGIETTFSKTAYSIRQCTNHVRRHFNDNELMSRVDVLNEWLDKAEPQLISSNEIDGVVIKIFKEKNFGFVRDRENREFFFHKGSLVRGSEWVKLELGTEVRFIESSNEKGIIAQDIKIQMTDE